MGVEIVPLEYGLRLSACARPSETFKATTPLLVAGKELNLRYYIVEYPMIIYIYNHTHYGNPQPLTLCTLYTHYGNSI